MSELIGLLKLRDCLLVHDFAVTVMHFVFFTGVQHICDGIAADK